MTNIFKASCVPIVIHSSVTFCYYNNLSVTEYSPYHSQLMFHTLYFLSILNQKSPFSFFSRRPIIFENNLTLKGQYVVTSYSPFATFLIL